ncbi:MAG: hypothetical protein A3H42_00440 [Deltaproteobacteria bacterium RIFCSPLOWO2_02_FULL_46_8]|nr:MAG: hypothetical protein A3H42_00440 [Deltaproteobacteria bacterium RIFCSPLOWO2_02_FULL_46_8]
MQFKLAEIFYSIQGEGIHVGRPSVFIRAALCNLRCVWCDTSYTWDWKKQGKEKAAIKMSVEDVIQSIQQWHCKNLVFTGGEPMLQQTAWIELMKKLKPKGYRFEVETNGTIPIELKFDALIDQYNCSPKLSSSKNGKKLRETEAFFMYAKNPKAWFKFVLTAPEDLNEINRLVKKYDLDLSRILLMPEGKTKEELKGRSKWLGTLAKENNFRFTPRLHIELWGNQRGV